MSLAQLNTSKGFYRYPQIEHFVSVKNYLFSFHNEQKYLLLRFSNDADFTVNSMEFTITQLDSTGAVLENTKVSYRNLQFAPGSIYTARQGIFVHDSCTDFKLQFSKLTSAEYIYHVEGRQVTVNYARQQPPLVPPTVNPVPIDEFRVQPIPLKHKKLSTLCGIVLILALLLLSVIQIYGQYRQPEEDVTFDQETSFVSE